MRLSDFKIIKAKMRNILEIRDKARVFVANNYPDFKINDVTNSHRNEKVYRVYIRNSAGEGRALIWNIEEDVPFKIEITGRSTNYGKTKTERN